MSDDAYIAYEVAGEGPRDVIVVMEGFIPIDTMEDEPRLARSMARLNSFARVIRFDRRGVGLSDLVSPTAPPTLERLTAPKRTEMRTMARWAAARKSRTVE